MQSVLHWEANKMCEESVPQIPEGLLFLGNFDVVTLSELEQFLKNEIVHQELTAKLQTVIINQNEAAKLMLARLHTWLEARGICDDRLKSLASPKTVLEMEGFIAELE